MTVGSHGERVLAAPGPEREPSAARLFGAAATVALVLMVVAFVLFDRTTLGRTFDDVAFIGARRTTVGDSRFGRLLLHYSAVFIALAVVLVLALGVARGRTRMAGAAALAVGVATGGAEVLRHLIPFGERLTATAYFVPENSFPSGHVAASVSAALAVVVMVGPRWRAVAALAGGAFASEMSVEVQASGLHRPGDIVGGALFALAVLLVAAAVVARLPPAPLDERQLLRCSRPWAVILAVTALAAVGAAALGWRLSNLVPHLSGGAFAAVASPSVLDYANTTALVMALLVVDLVVAAFLVLVGSADPDPASRNGRP